MTDEQLQQLAALAEAATPGPWWVDRYATDMSCTEHAVGVRTDDMMLASMGIDDVAMPDARFIAAARQAVPELLAEVSGLRRQLAEERMRANAAEFAVAQLRADAAELRRQLAEAQAELLHYKTNGVSSIAQGRQVQP